MAIFGVSANGISVPSLSVIAVPSLESFAPSISSCEPIQTKAGGPDLGVAMTSSRKYHLPSRGPRHSEQRPVPSSKSSSE